jgi:hypothetical protein
MTTADDRRTTDRTEPTDRSVLLVEVACFALMGAVVTLLAARRGDYDAALYGGLGAFLLAVVVVREYAARLRRHLVRSRGE